MTDNKIKEALEAARQILSLNSDTMSLEVGKKLDAALARIEKSEVMYQIETEVCYPHEAFEDGDLSGTSPVLVIPLEQSE